MKVTPVKRKFGRYKPGDVFQMPDRSARVFVRVGQLREVTDDAIAAPVEDVIVESVESVEIEQIADAADVVCADEAEIVAAEQEVEISPRTGLPKRPYRRRDMTAEG